MIPIKNYIIMSYFFKSFTSIFFFLILTISSFSQIVDNNRESRVNRKERKIDEIYKMETSNINLLPFAQEFHQRYEKYLKESIKRELKSRWADAMSAFGSGLQGSTANPETFSTTRIKNERTKIYNNWINEVDLRTKAESKQIITKPILKQEENEETNNIYSSDSPTIQYANEGENQYITEIIDGEIIKLDDGSIWQIEDSYQYISSIWLIVDDVVVKFYKKSPDGYCWKMKNNDETVIVKLLKQ